MVGENKISTTREAIQGYESTSKIFEALFREIKDLAKKKPESPLSAFKVKLINRLLEDIRAFLRDAPEHKYLDILDDVLLPQTADALVVMAQYEGALKGFRSRHFGWNGFEDAWFVKDKPRSSRKD